MDPTRQRRCRAARKEHALAEAQAQNPFAQLGLAGTGMPGPMINLLNPWCPLPYERVPGGQVQDPKYDKESSNPLLGGMSPYMMMAQGLDIAGFFDSPLEYKAFQVATQALEAAPNQRIALAEQALRMSPHCAEAYNVLAIYKAQNFEESLEYFRKGAELGPRAFEQERWEEQLEKKDLHDILPYRSVLRAAYGVANTLRKMGRAQEAYEAWQVLFQYSGKWHRSGTYCNVWAYYPEVLIRAKGPAAALEWMNTWKDSTDNMIYNSSAHIWTAAYVVAQAATQPGEYVINMTIGDDICVDTYKKGMAIQHLISTYPDLVDMLLGDVPLPRGHITEMIGGTVSYAAATLAAACLKDLVASLPGVAPHLRRYRNTSEVRYLGYDLRRGLGADVKEIQRYLDNGIYANGVVITAHGIGVSLLEEYVFTPFDAARTPEYGPSEIKVLRALLQAGCPVVRPPAANKYRRHDETMLTYSTYQGHGPKVTELLLQYGADPTEPNPRGGTALDMGANQGSWRECHVLLRDFPDLPQRLGKPIVEMEVGYTPSNALEVMLFTAFSSSCHACIDTGGRRACPRCSGGVQHPAAASFYSMVDVLLAHGLKPSAKLKRVLGEMVTDFGGGPYTKLLAHLKKSAAAGVTSAQLDERMAAQPSVTDKAILQSMSSPASPAAQNLINAISAQFAAMLGGGGQPHQHSSCCGSGCSHGGHHHHHHHAPPQHQHSGSCGSGCSHDHHHHHPAPQQQQQRSRPASAATGSSKLQKEVAESSASLAAAKQRPKACWGCGTSAGKLSRCAGCGVAYFCSKDCQKDNWGAHKADCKAWKALQAVEGLLGGRK